MISAIVAVDNNFAIGNKNGLLAHIPEDLRQFKQLTTGSTVIMGRKTYESLPKRPLPNRMNLVITSQVKDGYKMQEDGAIFMSMDYAKNWILHKQLSKPKEPIFVIGGGQIYKELLPYCDKLYITKINHSYKEADTYFPNIDEDKIGIIKSSSDIKDFDGLEYQFFEYVRNPKTFPLLDNAVRTVSQKIELAKLNYH